MVLEHSVGALFRDAFFDVVKKHGLETGLKLAMPDTGVWEFQKGHNVVTLHTSSAAHDMEEMVIQSDNFDLSDLISDTVKELIGRLLTTFAEVNGPVDRQDMDAKVSRLLQDLGLSNRNE